MDIIRLKLKDPASGERRFVSVGAATVDEAVEIVMRQEAKKVSFYLSPAEALELEKLNKEGAIAGRDKARLFTHQQTKPYVIEKAKEA